MGFFLVVSFLRILFGWNLSWLLIGFYIVVFALAAFVPDAFLAVAFDSGGVTTGPITVPFIMALGLGLTAVRGDKNAESDSFGLVALCSIGPILSVLILGMIYNPEGAGYTPLSIPDIASTRELWLEFGHALPDYAKEVLLALAPILAFFVVFQVFFLKLRRKALVKILVGMLYTLVGLTLFLTGVNVGFMPAGNYIGKQLAELPYNWVLVPLGMLIGYYIVKAEPAVLVLNKQVEEITGGAISQKVMMAGPFHRHVGIFGAFDGTRADGRFSAVVPGAGLCACARPQLSCAQDLYSHCLRFRRRGLRPHDGHVSAALCHGRVRGRGGQYSDRRLRHRGHGRHDAAHHHPDHRPCVPVQNAPCAGSGRSARGAGRGDHRIRRIGRGGRNMTDFISPVRCMVTIVDRGKGDRVVDLCRARHVAVQLVMLGHGTASAEVMDYLGLDEPEKDIVLSLVPGALVAPLLADLTLALGFSRPGKGIAFTVPLSGISAAANRQTDGGRVRAEINVEREVPPMTENNQFELIISVVEHGMADDVMAAAKTAGARGGTVARARGLSSEEAEKFLHITIQPEKDVVLILTAAAQKQSIMKAICNEAFARTGERGIAFSVPVSDVTGLDLVRLAGQAE